MRGGALRRAGCTIRLAAPARRAFQPPTAARDTRQGLDSRVAPFVHAVCSVGFHDSIRLGFSRLGVISRLACLTRGLWRGRALHRAGLWAHAAGCPRAALRLLDAAADRYRAEGMVEPLARLRVHELMIRAASVAGGAEAPGLEMEIERRLLTLETIEVLAPPFALVSAPTLAGSAHDDACDIVPLAVRAGAGAGLRILRQAA